MKNTRLYQKVKERHTYRSSTIKNSCIAFLSGGFIGLIAQILYVYLHEVYKLNDIETSSYIILGVIIITSITTGLGVYDKLAHICGAGLFIPISGFANALTSCALEYRSEGPIFGIGSNMFKYAGSVITYGIVSVYVFGLIRYFFNI